MHVPESTSVEAFENYVGGKCVRACSGPAWKELKASIMALPPSAPAHALPSVGEPFLAWFMSGDVHFQEREGTGPWRSHRIQRGTYFLTSAGSPYECRWESANAEPFQGMTIFLEIPLVERALKEVFGADAEHARLRDLSAFRDEVLDGLMEPLHAELMRREASPLFIHGIAEVLAVHLARNYAELTRPAGRSSPSLPGYKLKQITASMAENLSAEFNLDQLAAQVKLSKFHFLRLFKRALGVSPSRYHLNLRMDAARRLLRETEKSVVEIALEVGYTNPSHFAQLFRRETGLAPSDYRRQR